MDDDRGNRIVVYNASPTISKFHKSKAWFRGLRGPVGSGKTSGCINDIMMIAHAQHPSRDGVRRTRWAAVRNTYGELKSTTIQSWIDWFGENRRIGFGPIVYDVPIRQEIIISYPNNPVHIEMWFLSADREDHVKKFKSLEVTGVWLNEASELLWPVVEMLDSRHGRYPSVREKPDDVPLEDWPTWHGMIADTNSPITRNWWHQKSEVERPEGWEFFTQPGGLDEKAENIGNLPGGRSYYTRMMTGKSQAWIDQFINNQYGSSLAGKRVYTEFNDRLHVSPTPLKAYNGIPLRLGWDYGLTPACIIGQLTPRGQLRVLKELVATDMGIERFAGDVVVPFIRNTYPGLRIISRGDPGGNQRAQTDEKTCEDILASAGIPTQSAPTNLLIPRLTAVRRFLTKLVDGEPAFLLDPSCVMLREGFNGGYHYPQLKVVGDPRYKEEPDKNEYSHPHDGLQYLCLDIATELPKPTAPRPRSGYRGPADRTAGY